MITKKYYCNCAVTPTYCFTMLKHERDWCPYHEKSRDAGSLNDKTNFFCLNTAGSYDMRNRSMVFVLTPKLESIVNCL